MTQPALSLPRIVLTWFRHAGRLATTTLLFAFLCWCFLSFEAFAQVSTTSPDPASILSASFNAMGASNLLSIQDTKTTVASPAPDGTSSTSAIFTKGFAELRVESQFSDGSSVFTVNQDGAASQTDSDPVQQIPLISVWGGGITNIPVLSILSQWSSPGIKLSYLGLEEIGTESVHHIQIQRPLDPSQGLGAYDAPCDIYIDASTLLVSRLIFPLRPPSNLRTIVRQTADYSNYQISNGVAVPFTVQYSVNGQVLVKQQVTSFAVNLGTPDSVFDLE